MHACYMRVQDTIAVLTPHFRMRVRERLKSDERAIAKMITRRLGKQLCIGQCYSIRFGQQAVKVRKVYNSRRKRVELEFISVTPLNYSFRGDIKINLNERRL